MKRRQLVGGGIAAAVTAGLGYAGYFQWGKHEARLHARPAVKLAAIHHAELLRLNQSQSATFGEYLGKADTAISEIQKAKIGLRSAADTSHPAVTASLEFMTATEESIRANTSLARKGMAFKSLLDQIEVDLNSREESLYARQYQLQRVEKAFKEVEVLKSEAERAARVAIERGVLLRNMYEPIDDTLGGGLQLDALPLDEVIKQLRERYPDAKSTN